MSADTLTATSRAFYERSKSKVAISIVTAAAAMMLLGFCSAVGGLSQSAQYSMNNLSESSDAYKSLQSEAAGYGFASFTFIVGFILLLAAAIYISPFFFGSNNEVKMIRAPQEIETGYSAYSENPASSAPSV